MVGRPRARSSGTLSDSSKLRLINVGPSLLYALKVLGNRTDGRKQVGTRHRRFCL